MVEKLTYRELTESLRNLRDRLDAMDTFMTGIVALVGKDEILEAAASYAEEQARKTEEMMSAQVKSGIEDGWIKPIPVSGLKSLLIGVEESPMSPRPIRMQIIPEGIMPKDRGNYIGRQVGEEFVVNTPAGPVKTKITEIYEIDQERRKEVIAANQARTRAAAEAQAAAPVEAPAAEATDAQPVPPPADAGDADLV